MVSVTKTVSLEKTATLEKKNIKPLGDKSLNFVAVAMFMMNSKFHC